MGGSAADAAAVVNNTMTDERAAIVDNVSALLATAATMAGRAAADVASTTTDDDDNNIAVLDDIDVVCFSVPNADIAARAIAEECRKLHLPSTQINEQTLPTKHVFVLFDLTCLRTVLAVSSDHDVAFEIAMGCVGESVDDDKAIDDNSSQCYWSNGFRCGRLFGIPLTEIRCKVDALFPHQWPTTLRAAAFELTRSAIGTDTTAAFCPGMRKKTLVKEVVTAADFVVRSLVRSFVRFLANSFFSSTSCRL